MFQQKPCLAAPPRRRKRDAGHDHDAPEQPEDNPIFDDIDSMDAASYLSRVRAQASRLPEIFEAPPSIEDPAAKRIRRQHANPNDVITGSAASLHYMLQNGSCGVQPPPSSQHVPASGSQWVDQTLASFSQLRLYLEQCLSQGVGSDKARRIAVPPMKNSLDWYTFCVGAVADGDDGNNKSSNAEEEATPAWKTNLPTQGYAPTVSLLLQLDQVMVRRVLGHLTHHLCENQGRSGLSLSSVHLPEQQQQQQQQQNLLSWLYALLARLERPIPFDDAVTLYTLLKVLTAARTAAIQHRRSLATLNILIAAVGIYLEQGGGYANVMEVKNC